MLQPLLRPLLGPLLRPPLGAGNQTLIQRAISILRRYGTDAHIYLPGVGMLNGLQAANYIDSAGTQAGAVDQPVGLVLDASGGLGVALANCTFTSGLDGWTNPYQSTVAAVGGKLRVTATGSNPYASLALTTVIGTTYKISLSISAGTLTGNSITIIADNTGTLGNIAYGTLGSATAPGGTNTIPSYIFTATSTVFHLRVRAGIAVAGEYFEVDDVLIQEVTGIHGQQPTTSAKPILRRGAVNLLTYSHDLSNAAWTLQNGATLSGSTVTLSADGRSIYHSTTGIPAAPQTFAAVLSGSGTCTLYGYNGVDSGGGLLGLIQVTLSATPALFKTYFPATTTTSWAIGRRSGDTATSVTIAATGVFSGNLTAAQIQALGGIPTTLTAPVSTALGAYWWDTSGSKSLVATFPAGNESVTVINATPTGQVTTTAQNVVGAYSINTNTNGRIIVNGAMTAPELTLLQSLANKMAGL